MGRLVIAQDGDKSFRRKNESLIFFNKEKIVDKKRGCLLAASLHF